MGSFKEVGLGDGGRLKDYLLSSQRETPLPGVHTLGLKSRTEGRVWAEKLETSFLDCSLTLRTLGKMWSLVYSSVKWEELQELPSQGLHVAHKHSSVPFLLVPHPQDSFKNQNCSNEKSNCPDVSLKRETGTLALIPCRTGVAAVELWPSQGGTLALRPPLPTCWVPPRPRVSCL